MRWETAWNRSFFENLNISESWKDIINSCIIGTIPQGCDYVIDELIDELENKYNIPSLKNEDESIHAKVELVKLIDNNGNVLDKNGYAKEGIGIFDTEGYDNYMAGVAEDNRIVVNQEISKKEGTYALNFNGDTFNFKADDVYSGERKFDKIIKESKKNCNKEEIKCEREVCICGRR